MPDVLMPRLSDTMTEGAIAQWLKSEGETVQRGDVLAEIETDKAVMDLEAYESGVLEKILVQPGQSVPIGEAIAVIGDGASGGGASGSPADQAADETADEGAETDTETDAEAGAETDAEQAPDTPSPAPADLPAAAARANGDGRLKASPVVRSLARTHGIDLSTVTGTGPGGRIIRADVEQLLGRTAVTDDTASPDAASSKSGPAQATRDREGDEKIPLSRIRRITAQRLTEAAMVPAFQLTTVLDATKLMRLRGEINAGLPESSERISVTDLLVRACAVALRAHPEVNASFGEDAIIRRARVNVGIAVALEDGLIVPVIKDADRKSLREIGSETKDLATRARSGKLTPDEFTGGTFTVSNLGMFGIDNFTAVLNPPEAAILAVGSTADEPVVIDGEVTVRARMRLTLTVDHRVLDGATGAAFLRDLTDLLAEPVRMLV